jgi:signal peptidase II
MLPAVGRVMAQRLALTSLMIFVLALIGCDHATKVAAESRLSHSDPMALVPGVLELRYVENQDSAFSLTEKLSSRVKIPLLAVTSSLGLLAVGLLARKKLRGAGSLERIGLALLVAGAIANVVDRLRRGFVVDFIYVHHWPVFNVADILVVLGMALLAVQAFAGRLTSARGSPPAAS